MNIKEINNILNEILFTKYIGIGTKGICFKRKEELIKIFYYNYFNTNEMIKYLNNLYNIKNDTYIVPYEILIKNNTLIGYKEPYINAKTLNKIDGNITNIFNGFDKLINDTKEISDKGLILRDLHNKNILFNNKYHIIDLDNCIIDNQYIDNKFNHNMNIIIETILNSIFNIKLDETFYFYNNKITELRDKKVTNYKYFYDLIDTLINNSNSKEINLIRKRTMYTHTYNDYYMH